MYSIINHKTLEDVNDFYEQILRVKDADTFPMVLVGNKCDLESNRQVKKEEGKEYADKIGAPFLEASAKARYNVDEAFSELVRVARKAKNPNPNKPLKEEKHKKGCLIL